MASIAASALSNICTSQSGTAVRIFWGQSGCVFGGTMTILKPIRVLLSTSLHRLYASYTTALLCLPGLPFFRFPHWYGTRHNVDREQGTVNGSTRVSLLLVCEPRAARPGMQWGERSRDMRTTSALYFGMVAVGIVVFLAASPVRLSAQQNPADAVRIGDNDLGGVVTSAQGPEVGVWVIAETTDLPTKFAKIVVTDEQGRYVMPDLPKANYSVWVRGYGLVDSPKVQSAPGKTLNLMAVPAPHEAAAAQYYPAIYWYAMLKIPAKSEFPGTGPQGNGLPPGLKSQADWLANVKTLGCMSCHALGTIGTRTIPKELGTFHTSAEAWERRIQSGQAGAQMAGGLNAMGKDRALAMFADWTDRIAGGELPPAPPRPQGVERNVVI